MRCKKNIILSLEILISFYRNITSHLTEKVKIITLSLVIIMLSFANIINTSALNYQSSADVKFTFNPTLSIDISPLDLIIDNLTPGTNSDSNIINVSVATNASHGYTLAATVGDSLHNNTNLTHTNGANTFGSIATNSSLPNLTTDNTWGYSYKLSNNTNWNNYSGLSNETSKTLINTDSQLAKPIDFKIGAKASSTQPSGTYTNTINFIAISKPIPKTIEDIAYMQTFGELLPTDLQSVKDSMAQEHTYTLKDARDEQDYTIAKLKDGKIWMTKNLNLAGGTEITSELSDVLADYTLPTANGFQEGNKLPESSQEGFSDDTMAYVYNTGNNTDNCARPGCYSYYSWHAATAGSGVNINTNNTDAPYSICPKGWRLPNVSGLDFANLVAIYGSGADFYNNAGPSTIPNFLLAGFYRNSYFENGNFYGGYWSSKRYSNTMGINLAVYRSTVSSGNALQYYVGMSIHCLAR